MNRRRFSSSERVALYIAADGRCCECGRELEAGWHADHVKPYSRGGETDVINGQALCPECNRSKGARVNNWYVPEWLRPRRWQDEAQTEVLREAAKSAYALVEASPGAGKTLFALLMAVRMRQQELIAPRLGIAVPSVDLKVQWRDVAAKFGIQLTTKRLIPAEDEDGAVFTYMAISDTTVPILRKTYEGALVIGDEIHRAGADCEDVVWGDRVEEAFGTAFLPLLMSGTPVRPPGKGKLPFVKYEGMPPLARSTYSYGYAKALADECVRELIFPSYEGDVEWFDWDEWERVRKSFADELSDEQAARRYKHALTPRGKLLPGVLKKADDRLTHLRRHEHGDAGGLALCMDQKHAEKVAIALEHMCSEEPSLVISNNENAAEELKKFRRSSKRWLVAVNKISEGVDIPRLRVEVYATDIRSSEAAFRQRALRVGRYMPTEVLPKSKNRRGYVYLLADPVLLGHAEKFKEERLHALQIKEEQDAEENTNGSDKLHPLRIEDMDIDSSVVTSDPHGHITITPDHILESEEIAYAEDLRRQKPALGRFTPEDIVEVLRANSEVMSADQGGTDAPPTVAPLGEEIQEERKDKKRQNLARLVGFAANKHGREFSHINRELNDFFVRPNRDKFTELDLDEAEEYMKREYGVW